MQAGLLQLRQLRRWLKPRGPPPAGLQRSRAAASGTSASSREARGGCSTRVPLVAAVAWMGSCSIGSVWRFWHRCRRARRWRRISPGWAARPLAKAVGMAVDLQRERLTAVALKQSFLHSGNQVSVLLTQLPDCPANMDEGAAGQTGALEALEEVR